MHLILIILAVVQGIVLGMGKLKANSYSILSRTPKLGSIPSQWIETWLMQAHKFKIVFPGWLILEISNILATGEQCTKKERLISEREAFSICKTWKVAYLNKIPDNKDFFYRMSTLLGFSGVLRVIMVITVQVLLDLGLISDQWSHLFTMSDIYVYFYCITPCWLRFDYDCRRY